MNVKKILFSLAVVIAMIGTLASCNDTKNDNMYFTGHFVVEGVYPNYTAYAPGDITFHLSPVSVQNATGGKGFGNHKRLYLQLGFKKSNVQYADPVNKKGAVTISDAEVYNGQYINEETAITYATAESKNQTATDSISPVTKFTDYWYHRGYLNVALEADYSVKDGNGVYPGMLLTFKQTDIQDNFIRFEFLYNRHTSKDVSKKAGSFITAYSVNHVINQIPGNDSIRVVISAMGGDSKEFKIARR